MCKLNSPETNYKVSMRKKKKKVKTLINKIQNKAIFITAEEVKCFVFKYLMSLVYFMILSPNNVVRIWNRFWFLVNMRTNASSQVYCNSGYKVYATKSVQSYQEKLEYNQSICESD